MTLHVACAADAAFVPHCAAMLHSLLGHHDPGTVAVHFLHDESLPQADLDRLGELVAGGGGEWHAHRVGRREQDRCPDNRRFGRVAWYRVLLPELLPGLSRILYLDADTLVRRPLHPLWQTELGGRPLAAVANPLYPFMDQGFLAGLGLASTADYFNSGVLLLDLEVWRHEGLSGRVLTRAATQGRQEWPDQNALNVVLRGRWLSLTPVWNAQNTVFDLRAGRLPFSREAVREARRHPAVVHFIGPYKPWHYRCKHPLRRLYWRHLAATPWRGLAMEGRTLKHRLLRPLPEQWGWNVEERWRRLRRRWNRGS